MQTPLINMFWYGDRLPELHQMCISSFLEQGHRVDLYSYESSLEGLPVGVTLKDANDILSSDKVFRGKGGSYALFADQFRYELLHRLGGWWSDCDVYCIRPFNFDAEYVFGFESPGRINNAVIKVPSGGPLTRQLVEKANQLAEHRDWNRTIPLFHDTVVNQCLDSEAVPSQVFYPIPFADWKTIFRPGDLTLSSDCYAIHLWGEMIRRHATEMSPPFANGSPATEMWQRSQDHAVSMKSKSPEFTLYVLSYNCPRQFEYWVNHCELLHQAAAHKVLIDNTNQEHLSQEYELLCNRFGFEHVQLNNAGIMGGRIVAADHFVNRGGTDLCIFCEDDHLVHHPTDERCRSGFPKYIDGWLDKALRLVHSENLDYLKLCFSEVFFNNDVQVSWHNVTKSDRAKLFPGAKCPPPTKFTEAKEFEGLEYLLGEVFWCTWPSIMSRKGSLPLLRTDFQGKHDTYAMGELYKLTLAGKYKPAILKATLGYHHREYDYNRETRKL